MTDRGPRRALVGLCVTQITSWGILYYALPVVLGDLTRETGWSPGSVMTAFSGGLVASAVMGVPVGRLVDRWGPRPVMTAGSTAGVAALLAVAAAPAIGWFFGAWLLAGVAQAAVLYPPAFAALTRWYGPGRVRALTILSLAGGLASTVYAPITAALVGALGWRQTYVVLAILLGLITIPVHALCLTPKWPAASPHRSADRIGPVVRSRTFVMLAFGMTLAAFGMYGATLNLVPLLTGRGFSNDLAAIALALCGVGQVLGRLGYGALTRRTTPAVRTGLILTIGAGAIGLLAVVTGPLVTVLAVATFAGAVRGTYTLLQATAVSDRWGTMRFASINGVFIAPMTAAIALSPAGTAVLADLLGGFAAAFWVLTGLTVIGAAISATAGIRAR